jgi:hypothetical protein
VKVNRLSICVCVMASVCYGKWVCVFCNGCSVSCFNFQKCGEKDLFSLTVQKQIIRTEKVIVQHAVLLH